MRERRWERVLLAFTAFLLVVLLVVCVGLEVQVQSIKTSSHNAEQAAKRVNNGIDKRTPARVAEQKQIAKIAKQVNELLELCQ